MDTILDKVTDLDGVISPQALSEVLKTTIKEISIFSDLEYESLIERNLLEKESTQKRLRLIIKILDRVTIWTKSVLQTIAWYRHEKIPAFGEQTCEDLVKSGKIDLVTSYLNHLERGGFS